MQELWLFKPTSNTSIETNSSLLCFNRGIFLTAIYYLHTATHPFNAMSYLISRCLP